MDVLRSCKMPMCKMGKCPPMPIVRKCCFCVPIRKGVTIFGYVNLVLSLLSFPLLVFLLVEHISTGRSVDDTHMDPTVHLPLTIAFVVIDVCMTIVLLVGAHQKRRVLMLVYLYFGVVFQLLTLIIDLVYFDYREYVENAVYFIFLGLNLYMLFLVYNTVRVLKETTEVQYVVYKNQPVVYQHPV